LKILAAGRGNHYKNAIIMTQKTQKELLSEKRALALRENLRRRKEAVKKPDTKTEKK
jgi:hypothetical protein